MTEKTYSALAPEGVPQTFFTVEIVGGSDEFHKGACMVIELAIESAMALLKTSGLGRRGMPKVVLHRPGRMNQ